MAYELQPKSQIFIDRRDEYPHLLDVYVASEKAAQWVKKAAKPYATVIDVASMTGSISVYVNKCFDPDEVVALLLSYDPNADAAEEAEPTAEARAQSRETYEGQAARVIAAIEGQLEAGN